MVAISRSLRVEADRHGVRVSVVCPGVIRTPILTGGKYGRFTREPGLSDEEFVKRVWEPLRPLDVDVFAQRVFRRVLRNDAIIIVPAWWKAFWYLERLSPALSLKFAAFALTRSREVQAFG